MKFTASGHSNVCSTHATTLEITKDTELTPKGDCIIAVNADYSLEDVKRLLDKDKLTLTMEADGLKETIHFTPNKLFNDEKEIVIRTTDFISKRTLGIQSDKAAKDLSKEFIEKLRNKDKKIIITIK